MKPEKSRTHEDRFRCPQCGRLVTVTAGFRREDREHEALVRFECTMEGLCGSPIWDPCPMYVAYMERVPPEGPKERPEAERSERVRKAARSSLKDAW